MSEPGLYALTKAFAGGLSAIVTGPFGTADLPDIDMEARIAGNVSGYSARVTDATGAFIGHAGMGTNSSPSIARMPDRFIQALVAVEDSRFGQHPGVDPHAVASAAVDTLMGSTRGGSTLTQQLVKNSITGADTTLDRKVREAILSVRVSEGYSSRDILQGYLANVWFGRGQNGAAGASLAWFGKEWSDIELHEAAFLAGILKGPAWYDPVKYPDRALARRNIVLKMMMDGDMITAEDFAVAKSMPLDVIPEEKALEILDALPTWTASGIEADFERYGLTNRSDIAQGDLDVVTTISARWQGIAEDALASGIYGLSPPGPALSIPLGNIQVGDALTGENAIEIRRAAAAGLATTRKTGRAIIHSVSDGIARTIVDRGYGPLEWIEVEFDKDALGFVPGAGDVLPYRREDDAIVLESSPQVQGAVVVMNPATGAILASVGGVNAELNPFDRTRAMRQPGSAIKPFLWVRALDEGMRYDDMVDDREKTYYTIWGTPWRPTNYDGTESGLIPLFVGLEESSNLVAASLVSRLGIDPLARITELAGIYDWGEMSRHPSSALGASETSLTRLAAGYAAIANGGLAVNPHHIREVRQDGQTTWRPRDPDFAIATRTAVSDVTSMLYGVTQRGTAYQPFRDSVIPVAGKTGTSQHYRDAWFISYTSGVVVGVWIGRDDNAPIPGEPTGSRAAAPIARTIYDAALEDGLLDEKGMRPEQVPGIDWPPQLLSADRARPAVSSNTSRPQPDPTEPFKRPVQQDPPSSPVRDPMNDLKRVLGASRQNGGNERGWHDGAQRQERYLDEREDPNAVYTTRPSGNASGDFMPW